MAEAKLVSGWPELGWESWKDTATTLHMWTQIVGKTRLALTPLQNDWWNVPLYVSARGLTTSPMPWRDGLLEIQFDFHAHVLRIWFSDGRSVGLPLRAQSVASFFAEYKAALACLGVEVKINPVPCELQSPIRFDLDYTNASYERAAVERFHTILIHVATLFKQFATGFQGKISPVHFFWGSFDLCVTRFSGRPAPPREGADFIQREAYSQEVISCGFWPGNGGFGAPAFYCYGAPVPAGLNEKAIHPGVWDSKLGEFILLYNDARKFRLARASRPRFPRKHLLRRGRHSPLGPCRT
jgi:hypothetical protein